MSRNPTQSDLKKKINRRRRNKTVIISRWYDYISRKYRIIYGQFITINKLSLDKLVDTMKTEKKKNLILNTSDKHLEKNKANKRCAAVLQMKRGIRES